MTLAAGFQLIRAGWILGFALLGAAPAAAQVVPLRLPEGTTGCPTVQATTRPPEPAYRSYDPGYAPYPVAVTYLPAILMSDGTVYANFGFGYEPVRRACRQPRVLDGRGFSREQYTHRAPNQETASAQNLPSAQAQRQAASRAAYSACFTRTARGGLVVVR
jgi:hypothetical protein